MCIFPRKALLFNVVVLCFIYFTMGAHFEFKWAELVTISFLSV